jgi:hypothetical protein
MYIHRGQGYLDRDVNAVKAWVWGLAIGVGVAAAAVRGRCATENSCLDASLNVCRLLAREVFWPAVTFSLTKERNKLCRH